MNKQRLMRLIKDSICFCTAQTGCCGRVNVKFNYLWKMPSIPWFRRLYIRWLLWQRRKSDPPTLYDKYGYPYWLKEDTREYDSYWILTGCFKHEYIATVQLLWFNANDLRLEDIRVSKKYRRYGLGSQLLNRVKEFGHKHNFTVITGLIFNRDYAEDNNLPAWYEHHGFTVTPFDKSQNDDIASITFKL